MKRAKSLYRQFHGADNPDVRRASMKTLKDGDALVEIGVLEAVIYRPRVPSKRAKELYEHWFGDRGDGKRKSRSKPILAVSEDGESFFIVKAKSGARLTDRGIVG